MDFTEQPAIATLTLPTAIAKVIPAGDAFILWWTDCVTNHWSETHPNLSTALTRLAVLEHCITTNEGFNHPTPEEFAPVASAFLESSITAPRRQSSKWHAAA